VKAVKNATTTANANETPRMVMKKRKALAHQAKALEWAFPRNRIPLFMRMRLGKTLVAIRWAQNKGCKKILVIAPLTVVPTWQEELRQEGVWLAATLLGPEKQWRHKLDQSHTWYLTNYERARLSPWLFDLKWDCLILDESVTIRKPKAQITKLLVNECQHIPYRAALTGMPNPESFLDFFEQMRFLFGEFLGFNNYWHFADAHFNSVGYDLHIKRKSRDLIIGTVHKRSYVLTRKDVGVGSTPVHQTRWLDLPSPIRKKYKHLEDKWAVDDYETACKLTQMLWLQKIAGGCAMEGLKHKAKLKELLGLLGGELRGEQVIVWFRFNDELFACQKKIGNAVSIYGDVPIKVRKARLKKFTQGKARVLLAQAACAKYGLDCSNSDTMIYFSRYFDANINLQSQERFIHPKQKRDKLIIDLVVKDTVDVDILTAIKTKKFQQGLVSNQLLKRMILKNFSERLAA